MKTHFSIHDPDISDVIRQAAQKLSRAPGFAPHEREDIEQDLNLHVWERRGRFDRSKGTPGGFTSTVTKRRSISMIRHRMADKRSPLREECSLDDPVMDGDGRIVDRHQVIAEATNVPQRLRDLEHDVANVLAGLSDIQRAIAVGIGNGTVNSLSNDLGIPRSAVERHLSELREIFEDAGLRAYL